MLGLDYGDKTIGVAVSDPGQSMAFGVEVIRRDNPNSFKKSIARLSELIKAYEVDTIVLGYPKNMDNTLGQRCLLTEAFKERLERNFKKMKVILWDERLSSVQAMRTLKEGEQNKKQSQMLVDQVAAVHILQSYLDWAKKGENADGRI